MDSWNEQEEDLDRPLSHKRSRAAEEQAYEAADPYPDTLEDEYPRGRSFSRSLFSPDELPAPGQRQKAPLIVPSNISINAKIFT